jgi:hypothetical protein
MIEQGGGGSREHGATRNPARETALNLALSGAPRGTRLWVAGRGEGTCDLISQAVDFSTKTHHNGAIRLPT